MIIMFKNMHGLGGRAKKLSLRRLVEVDQSIVFFIRSLWVVMSH
jgi:hypothetical protein